MNGELAQVGQRGNCGSSPAKRAISSVLPKEARNEDIFSIGTLLNFK